MALWGETKLLSCILLVFCCLSVTLAQVPRDCCLAVKDQKVQKNKIVDYFDQVKGQGCSIDATVLVTTRGRKLCVPHNVPWVKKVKEFVDQKECKKNPNFSRCK